MPPDDLIVDVRRFEYGGPEWEQSIALRLDVLRRPLGLDLSADKIEQEKGDDHIGAFRDEELCGSLILTARPAGAVQMRAVAVRPTLQRLGIGARLVDFAERFAVQEGYREMVLNARHGALSFYERLGYVSEGEPFILNTLPHRRMRKSLPSGA